MAAKTEEKKKGKSGLLIGLLVVGAGGIVYGVISALRGKPTPTPPPEVGILKGTVTNKSTGSPLEAVVVQLGEVIYSTNTSGYYEIGDLSSGVYTLTFLKDGYNTEMLTVTYDTVTGLVADVQLAPTAQPGPSNLTAALSWD